LYDRSLGRYVSLRDVEEAVKRGVTVTIKDSRTGEDLTRAVLTQILLERYPERMGLFPVPFLHLVLRANETMLGFLRDYLGQSLAYAELLQRASAVNPLLSLSGWMRALVPSPPPRAGAEWHPAPEGRADFDALTRRLAELERRLEEMQVGPAPDAVGPKRRR
jgi:polyhydroxyalkanoate synthesis repressor PhaR